MYKNSKLGLVLLWCMGVNLYTMDMSIISNYNRKNYCLVEGKDLFIEKSNANLLEQCNLEIISEKVVKMKIKSNIFDKDKLIHKPFFIKLHKDTINQLLHAYEQENNQRYQLKIFDKFTYLIIDVQKEQRIR